MQNRSLWKAHFSAVRIAVLAVATTGLLVSAFVACGGIADSGALPASSAGCPTTDPVEGATCNTEGTSCKVNEPVVMSCGKTLNASLNCLQGHWRLINQDNCGTAQPQCPPKQPPSQTACSVERQRCGYSGNDNGDCFNYTMECDQGAWESVGVAWLAQCPASKPVEGSACDSTCRVNSSGCRYPNTLCTGVGCTDDVAVCSNGKWYFSDEGIKPAVDGGASDGGSK